MAVTHFLNSLIDVWKTHIISALCLMTNPNNAVLKPLINSMVEN